MTKFIVFLYDEIHHSILAQFFFPSMALVREAVSDLEGSEHITVIIYKMMEGLI